jgi:hypothetical protein
MNLDDLKKLNVNLPTYQGEPNSTEITVGGIVAEAKISTTADAWEEVYSRIKGTNKYHHSGQGGISQLEDSRFPGSRNRPKRFYVSLIGIMEERKKPFLVYAKSVDDDTEEPHTLRKTPLEHITRFRDYKLVFKNKSHGGGLYSSS